MNIDTGEILDLEEVKRRPLNGQEKFKPIPPEFQEELEFLNREKRREFYRNNKKRFKEYAKNVLEKRGL